MSLATLYIPAIVFKARKFALLFSFGSVFFLSRYWNHRFVFSIVDNSVYCFV